MALFDRFRADRELKSLVAGAQLIDLSNEKVIEAALKRQEHWQKRAFDLYEIVGEIHFTVEENASLASRLPIFAAEIPEDQNGKPERTKNDEVAQVIEDLGNPVQRAELQHDLLVQYQVPGECFLVGISDDGRDEYDEYTYAIASIEEISTVHKNGKKIVTLTGWNEDGSDLLLDNDADIFVRTWRRSLRKRQEATSHVRAIMDAAEELLWWDSAAVAAAKSRHTLAGLLGVPSNLELPATTEEDARLSGSQRFINMLQRVMGLAIANPRGPEAAIPIAFTYPYNGEGKSGIERIEFERPQDELLDARTDRALLRIAQGLNAPIETVTGMGQATQSSGGLIEEGQFRKHVEPDAVLMVNAFTSAYLHPVLRKKGIDPSKYIVWYDESALIINQNKTRDVIRLVELGGAAHRAARRVVGLSESDAPTEEEKKEIMEWLIAARKGGVDHDAIVEDPQRPEEVEEPTTAPRIPEKPSGHPPVQRPTAPTRRGGPDSIAASTNGHGRDILISQLQVMGDEKVRRALEKAGNKLVTRARKVASYKNAISGTKQELVASVLGREAVIKLGIDSLFDGCFDSVPSRLVAFAQTHYPIETDYSPASAYFTSYLRELASQRLFDPPTEELLVTREAITAVLDKLPKPKVPV